MLAPIAYPIREVVFPAAIVLDVAEVHLGLLLVKSLASWRLVVFPNRQS